MLQKQVILALQGNEVGPGNASSQLAAGFERNHQIAARVHHESRHRDSGKKIADVYITHDVEVSSSALGGGRPALQFVEEIRLLVRTPRDK